jgi:hypothetical protein
MYNHNAKKQPVLTQTQTTPHYHEKQTLKNPTDQEQKSKALGWVPFHPWQSSWGEGLESKLAHASNLQMENLLW